MVKREETSEAAIKKQVDSQNISIVAKSFAMSTGTQLPFTFGVEFEFVFAILKSTIKDADNRRKYPRRLLESWLAPALAQILAANGLDVLVNGSALIPDYLRWMLDYEPGCRIKKPAQLSHTFPDDTRLSANSDDLWYHEGMELISRVMRTPELVGRGADNSPALTEIKKYLEALVADRNAGWFARTTEKCGLHIHIGVPDGDDWLPQIPLNILQHLAYILLEYEDVISCLHHPKRRGFYGSKNVFIGTNKLGINRHRHVCNQYTVATEIIRDKIFAADMDEEHLAELMGTQLDDDGFDEEKRYKFVNWEHIRRFNAEYAERAPTLEFRQHRGSLDFNDVSQWVRFLTALMRVAERRAQEATPPNSPSFPVIPRTQLTFPQREGRKYRFRCSRFQNRMEELFDLLGLDRLQKQYWISKLREYNAHEFIKQPYTRLCISCQALDELTDPEEYLRFCKSLEIIDASIDTERRLSGREAADWTEEDVRDREERIARVSGDPMDVDDISKSNLSSPSAIRTPRDVTARTSPYDRVVDPKARTRAGKSGSPNSSDSIFFELEDVPSPRKHRSGRWS